MAKLVDPAVVENVYRKFDGITASVQRMMNVLFFMTPANGHCTIDMVDKALQYILDLFDDNYATLLESLPEKQREVFRAIAAEGKAKGVTGSKFIRKYHLQTASVVNAALRGLMDKDLVTVDNGEYSVYDPFLAIGWKVPARQTTKTTSIKIILSSIVYCPNLSLRDILRRQSKTNLDNERQKSPNSHRSVKSEKSVAGDLL